MKKGGQAFLITAIIFIAIIGTLITIKNYSKKTEFSTFPYIAEEIQIESEKVMDYDLINTDNKIETFTQDVSNYIDEDTKIYFITKESGSLTCSKCNALTESNNLIFAEIDGETYQFTKYLQGKHFYFIMIKEINGEKYVYTNA